MNDQLVTAAFQCDLETIRKTLDAGADVNARDEYGQTALMLASESLKAHGKTDIIQVLLDRGADSSIKDPNGWTAADHFAIMGYFHEMGAPQKGLDLLQKAKEE